jgi:hypothetical protein
VKPFRIVRALVALGLSALGCQSLIGLEERHLGDEAWCVDYCDTVMGQCAGGNKVYSSRETCLDVCRVLEPGGPGDPPKSNTVFCRKTLIANSMEPDVDCSFAGPGGGDQCGSDCQAYCQILIASCAQVPTHDVSECERQCGALKRVQGGFNTSGLYVKGDSLQCRMFYASQAATDPSNCKNALIAPPDPDALCTADSTAPPTCDDYCRIAMIACTEDNALYESDAQCLAACNALPLGTNADSNGKIRENTDKNTMGCRKFHAYGALARPDSHCRHSGPTSDGYCGDEDHTICQSHCMIAKKACGALYTEKFATDADCEADCETLPGVTEESADDPADPHEYSLTNAKKGGGQVPCRTLHALRVLEQASSAEMTEATATECLIALGTVDCPVEP